MVLTWVVASWASSGGFRSLARPELTFPNVSSYVAELVARPSDCVPPGAILLSTTNEYHAGLTRCRTGGLWCPSAVDGSLCAASASPRTPAPQS